MTFNSQPIHQIYSIMTITKNHRETEINGRVYFVEQYAEKPHFTWFWRYGYMVKFGTADMGYIMKSQLHSRPNLKRLFGA